MEGRDYMVLTDETCVKAATRGVGYWLPLPTLYSPVNSGFTLYSWGARAKIFYTIQEYQFALLAGCVQASN